MVRHSKESKCPFRSHHSLIKYVNTGMLCFSLPRTKRKTKTNISAEKNFLLFWQGTYSRKYYSIDIQSLVFSFEKNTHITDVMQFNTTCQFDLAKVDLFTFAKIRVSTQN